MHFLMGRPEITSAAAVKGKRVGVSSFGATSDLTARVALQSIGIDPHRDVAIVTLGSDTLRYATPCMPRTCRCHLISR
jgi:ABC-type nitrate/sulfonate/bicarbonate transport system substrate-binding protein